eukprot:2070826-Prymnesium_polylepis.2
MPIDQCPPYALACYSFFALLSVLAEAATAPGSPSYCRLPARRCADLRRLEPSDYCPCAHCSQACRTRGRARCSCASLLSPAVRRHLPGPQHVLGAGVGALRLGTGAGRVLSALPAREGVQ